MNASDTDGHAAEAPDLSIVLVTWNSLEITAAALDSLRRHTAGIAYEVLVIDNGTTEDDTPTELPRRFPWVRFLANPDNRGFTRANNQGLRVARGRYVLLLNSDTIQTQNAPGEAVHYLDGNPGVGVLGIMHRNNDADRTFQPSCFPFPKPWRDTLALLGFRGNPTAPPAAVERDTDWVCGSFLMARRSVLDEIGLLDERYFAYDEDIDWCLSAKRAGWAVRFWPGASMIHIGSVAAPHLRDKTGMMFRSHVSYLRKNHGRPAAAGYYAAIGILLVLALAKQVLKSAIGRSNRVEIGSRWARLIGFLTLRPPVILASRTGIAP